MALVCVFDNDYEPFRLDGHSMSYLSLDARRLQSKCVSLVMKIMNSRAIFLDLTF